MTRSILGAILLTWTVTAAATAQPSPGERPSGGLSANDWVTVYQRIPVVAELQKLIASDAARGGSFDHDPHFEYVGTAGPYGAAGRNRDLASSAEKRHPLKRHIPPVRAT